MASQPPMSPQELVHIFSSFVVPMSREINAVTCVTQVTKIESLPFWARHIICFNKNGDKPGYPQSNGVLYTEERVLREANLWGCCKCAAHATYKRFSDRLREIEGEKLLRVNWAYIKPIPKRLYFGAHGNEDDRNNKNAPYYLHDILIVEYKDGSRWVVDFTGGQFGIEQVIWKDEEYMKTWAAEGVRTLYNAETQYSSHQTGLWIDLCDWLDEAEWKTIEEMAQKLDNGSVDIRAFLEKKSK